MFGTIFRMRPKPGQEAAIVSLFERWDRERKPKVDGALGGYLYRPVNRPNELVGVAVFSSRQTYDKNANDPEQDKWYRDLRAMLEADPEWEDGDVIAGS